MPERDADATPDTAELERLRYPIGRFRPKPHLTADERARFIREIAELPARLRSVVSGLSPEQLDTAYRSGGWTVRQVIHHIPDSHINSYVRFRLAITEDEPRISTYDEKAWAELPDSRDEDVETSLVLLESLHRRWVRFLEALDGDSLQRTFIHPDLGSVTLEMNLQLYAWHGRHHLAQIVALLERT